ncbi:MAG: anhydro-N-acetylmuramic acid kinase [Pseudomonadota bacterium]
MSALGIRQLAELSQKKSRRIIGLMSGTSLDGLDIALCTVRGSGTETSLTVDNFVTKPFDTTLTGRILGVFAKRDVDLEAVTLLNESIGLEHGRLVSEALNEWSVPTSDVDLIASHGQTIYHAPQWMHQHTDLPNATLQLGDGDHIAMATGILTISDFRQKHVAAGGEGAPLAAYGDYLLLTEETEDRLLLNIGGIANFTYLPARNRGEEAFSTDIGPGNTLMDAYVRKHYAPLTYDADAKLACAGTVDETLLSKLMSDAFLSAGFPKTTGPEHFALASIEDTLHKHGPDLSHQDVLATLNAFSAEAITEAVQRVAGAPSIYLSGGGARNPLFVERLKAALPGYRIGNTSELGIEPDAKEAILFAVLANELVAGDPSVFKLALPSMPAVSMGKISLPR